MGDLSTRSNTLAEWSTTFDNIHHAYNVRQSEEIHVVQVGMNELRKEESIKAKTVQFQTPKKRGRTEPSEQEEKFHPPYKYQFGQGVDPTQGV